MICTNFFLIIHTKNPTYHINKSKWMNQSKFLVDDSGAEVTVNNGLGELLDIKNVKVVYVRDPPPGKWRLRVDSSSAHTLRITGLSKFDFAAGFAKQRPTHITSTELRPLEGRACTILLISCIWNWKDIDFITFWCVRRMLADQITSLYSLPYTGLLLQV